MFSRAETICDWAGTGDPKGAQAFYEAECKKGAPAPSTPASAPKVEEKKEAPAAQPKPAPAKAAPKAKQPSKVKNINRWTIENYTAAETLRFEGEQEVNSRANFNVFDCKNITIEIVGKCSNVFLENCHKVTLVVDKLISQVEVQRSKVVKIVTKNLTPDDGPAKLPMVTAEGCNELMLVLCNDTKKTKVSTVCCRSVIMRFPKEGSTDEDCAAAPDEHMINVPIAEVYDTVIGEGNSL